ncbi:MAG: exo-alpha-sialidase, partial [Calditrichaeota bacterium]
MKSSLLILLILSNLILGRSLEELGYPERFIESAKSNNLIGEEEFHYDSFTTSLGEVYFILTIEESRSEPTVWKTRITNSPQIDWFSIGFENSQRFNFGVSELQLSEDLNCPKLTLKTTTNEIFTTNCQVNSIFGGGQNLVVNQLPPNAPTVWDTILWDEPEVLVSYNISGGSFAGGPAKLAVGDSGYVHFFSSVDDGFLRYHRSTDYGKTFEPTVVLDDTMGSILEVVATGDYVYAYVINQFFQANPQMRLYASSDNGANFVLAQLIDYEAKSGFAAYLNNAFDYQEYGSTDSVMQSKSFDIGQSFSPYTVVTDTVYGEIQPPSIAIGNNSIVYARTGNDTTLTGANVYRSFDLGENWLPFAEDLEPLADLQTPDVFAIGNTFHLCAVPNTCYYFRSEDSGQSFNYEVNLCEPNVNCSAEQFQQITAHDSTVFVNF